MNRRGHFFSGGGGTTVASDDEGVVEDIEFVSVSFSFLDFFLEECMTISPEWRLARLFG